jgi:hypothetical protein
MDYCWSFERIGAWAIALRIDNRAGALVASELRVFPYESEAQAHRGEWSGNPSRAPRRGLRSRELRRMVSLGRLLRAVRPHLGIGASVATRGRPPRISSAVLAEFVQEHLVGRRVAEVAREYGIAWKRPAKLIDLAAGRGLYDRRARRLTDEGRALVRMVKIQAADTAAIRLEDRGERRPRRSRPVVTKFRYPRRRKPRRGR